MVINCEYIRYESNAQKNFKIYMHFLLRVAIKKYIKANTCQDNGFCNSYFLVSSYLHLISTYLMGRYYFIHQQTLQKNTNLKIFYFRKQ